VTPHTHARHTHTHTRHTRHTYGSATCANHLRVRFWVVGGQPSNERVHCDQLLPGAVHGRRGEEARPQGTPACPRYSSSWRSPHRRGHEQTKAPPLTYCSRSGWW